MNLNALNHNFVITGAGCISPAGPDFDTHAETIFGEHHRRKVQPLPEFRRVLQPVIQNFVEKGVISTATARMGTKLSKLSVIASKEALTHSALAEMDREKIGIVLGTALSGTNFRENVCRSVLTGQKRVSPLAASRCTPSEPVGATCLDLAIKGYNTIVSSFESSSVDAMINACIVLNHHPMQAMLAVGAEEISDVVEQSLMKLKGCSNTLFCEGAAAVVIESEQNAEKRHAPTMASIKNISTRPSPRTAQSLKTAILKTMQDCIHGFNGRIDMVLTHGPPGHDQSSHETEAILELFGPNVTVANVKQIIGETAGPSGIFQILTCLQAMARNQIPKACPTGQAAKTATKPIESILTNCISPYGSCSSILIQKQ